MIILAYGGYRILSGASTLGRFTAYQAHMAMVVDKFNMLEGESAKTSVGIGFTML